MRKIFTFFLFSIIFLTNINYSHSIEPDIFIQSTVNRATSTLSGNLTKEETLELMLEWEELDVEQDILIKYYNIYFTD